MNSRIPRIAASCLMSLFISLFMSRTAKPGESEVVAKFQGNVITESDLTKAAQKDLENLELERIQFNANWERDKHRVLETNLSRLLEEKLLQAEAAQRGITKEQLLESELQGKVKDPTEDDIKSYYEANRQRISQPLLQITTQIYNYLKDQNYNKAKAILVDRLTQTHGLTVSLQPFRMSVNTEGNPFKGNAEAPVTLVEFSDFQCPYCSALFKTLQQIMRQYGAQVRLVYRNFPLIQIHPYAEKAAEAGLCAGDQGQFWQMHDLLFQTQGQLKEDDLKAKAAQLKLDTEAFNSCLSSGRNAEKVKRDMNAGFKLGVGGTPALFINGRFLSGAVPFEEIAKIIDEELRTQTKQVDLASK
jgi:predicted DsbA family dithiol-disulfide isomerase